MRVLLIGCGAIGGVIASELIEAGCDLSLVTGSAQICATIADQGILVRDLQGQLHRSRPPRPAVASTEELTGPFDVCLLATKSTTLEAAVRGAVPLLAPGAPLLCLQNGLPEERVAALAGADRVLGGVVGFGATLLGPAQVARSSAGGLQLGRLAAGGPGDEVLGRVAELLGRRFAVQVVADLPSVRWSKLAINCATSTLGAAGGDTLGRLLRHRSVRRLALEVWTEIAQVAQRSGVRMAKVAGTLDIAQIALTDADRRRRLGSPALFYKHSLLWAIGLKYRRMRSSMLVAIERGRTPEIDWLNGEVVRRGAALGVPTPVNAALVKLIHDIVSRRERPALENLRALARRLPALHAAPPVQAQANPASSPQPRVEA